MTKVQLKNVLGTMTVEPNFVYLSGEDLSLLLAHYFVYWLLRDELKHPKRTLKRRTSIEREQECHGR